MCGGLLPVAVAYQYDSSRVEKMDKTRYRMEKRMIIIKKDFGFRFPGLLNVWNVYDFIMHGTH